MNAMLDLLRLPEKKAFSTIKLTVLLAGILFSGALAWFIVPCVFSFIVSAIPRFWASVRSSIAPPYLFFAVNFIILTIWKLSENRALHTERLAEEESNSNPDIVYPRSRDLGSAHTVHLLRKTSTEEFNKTPSMSAGNVRSPDFAGEEPSPTPASDSSCITTESEDKSTATSSSSSSYGLPFSESALTAIDPVRKNETMVDETQKNENDSLDATWNTIMRKSGRWERSVFPVPVMDSKPIGKVSPVAIVGNPTGRASPAAMRVGNAMVEGNDDINQRFDDFIKKNYDQIRLRKPGESNQLWRIK